jgi:hypothetical protein
MREQRPENRGAAVCVDCESNKEKSRSAFHIPAWGTVDPLGSITELATIVKVVAAERTIYDTSLSSRSVASGNASRGHTVLKRSCSYLQPGTVPIV